MKQAKKTKGTEGCVSITLTRSPIGQPYHQRIILKGLGLRKLHQTVERPRTPQVIGLIDKVRHLIKLSDL